MNNVLTLYEKLRSMINVEDIMLYDDYDAYRAGEHIIEYSIIYPKEIVDIAWSYHQYYEFVEICKDSNSYIPVICTKCRGENDACDWCHGSGYILQKYCVSDEDRRLGEQAYSDRLVENNCIELLKDFIKNNLLLGEEF